MDTGVTFPPIDVIALHLTSGGAPAAAILLVVGHHGKQLLDLQIVCFDA